MQIGEIREIQNRPPVLAMDAARPLDAAIQEMCINNHGSVVVTEEGRVAGIVTERDLLKKILGAHRDTEELRLRDVMTRNIAVAHLDEELSDGLKKMKRAHQHHMPVVDEEGRVITMLSQSDFTATDSAKSLHLVKETTTRQFYDGFQPWLMTIGIITYFIITTAAILVYFGF